MARVDAQVIARDQQVITGLHAEDFVLLIGGKPHEIRNFGNEGMPVDVLLLLDVSGSMRPQIERLASAAHQALAVLSENDRVAIMVFDRATRARLPFRNSREAVTRELDAIVNNETFDGGTDVGRGILDAARYVEQNARRDARRAIVILTDDQSERGMDHASIDRALLQANAVLSLLLAPDMMFNQMPGGGGGVGGRRRGGGGWPGTGGGGGWPGNSGGMGGPLGGIIFGRRTPGGMPGGGNGPVVIGGPNIQPAGTDRVAARSGGDTFSIDNASAFEDTLARLRQRYSLYYYLPEDAQAQGSAVEVQLAAATTRRYPNAQVRYRKMAISEEGENASQPTVVTQTHPVATEPQDRTAGQPSRSESGDRSPGLRRRRPAVDEPVRPMPGQEGPSSSADAGGWRKATVDEAASSSVPPVQKTQQDQTISPPASNSSQKSANPGGGWRRVNQGQLP
jgi:hypothetical protein